LVNDGLGLQEIERKLRAVSGYAIPDNPGKQAKLDIAWRAHICTWAANQAIALEGDFIECGVWYGILSRTICNYVDFSRHDGTFYLVDTWGKMPGSHTSSNYQDDIFSVVQKRFSDVDNVQLIRGPVPDVLTQITSSKVAFLAIDMNGSVPERAALEYFYDKIVPGGVIYFDDYGWDFPELRATIEDFFMDKPETLLHFPSGNSIVVKL
jgi:O-methyltransferase